MPIAFTTDHRSRLVIAVVESSLSLSDLQRYVADRLAAGVYDYDQVIDVGPAVVQVGPNEILATVLPNRLALRAGMVPFTAIVASTPANLATARELSTRFGAVGATIGVFETLGQARAWLAARRESDDA